MLIFPATRMLSWFGLTAAGTSFTWVLWQETHQGWWIAASGLVGMGVGIISAPAAGWLADSRWRKQAIMSSALLSGLIYLAVLLTHSPVWLLIIGGASSVVASPFHPAFSATLLAAFSDQDQIKVLGWTTSAESVGVVAGTITGGALMTMSAQYSFILAAVCLAATSALAFFLPEAHSKEKKTGNNEHGGVWAGLKIIRADKILALMLGSVLFMSISRRLATVAEPALVGAIHGNSLTLSLISAAWSIGMVAGGLAAAKWAKRNHSIRYLWQARMMVALGMGFNFVAQYTWQPIVAYVLCGLAWAWIPVSSGAIIAERCPEDKRGRLLAFQGALVQAAATLGIVGAGLCIQIVGVRQSFLLSAVVGLLSVPPLLLASRRYKDEQPLCSS